MIYEEFVAPLGSRHNGTVFHASQPGSCNHHLSQYVIRKNKKKLERIYTLNYNNTFKDKGPT